MQTVIFDSNSYRYLVRGKTFAQYSQEIIQIKALESRISFKPTLSMVVLSELMKHLVDPTDVNYDECKNAVAAAVLHCRERADGVQTIPCAPGMDNAIYFEVFGKYPENDHEKSLALVADRILNNFTDNYIKSLHDELNINLQNEQQNRDNFFNAVVASLKVIDPASTGFEDFLKDKNARDKFFRDVRHDNFKKVAAYSKLSRIRDERGNEITATTDLIDKLAQKFSPALELERLFWEKVAGRIPMKDGTHKEINTLYDIMILIGGLVSYPNMLFVTREIKLHESFKASGMKNQIIDLPDYLSRLGAIGINLIGYS